MLLPLGLSPACRFHPFTERRERSRFRQDDRPLLMRDVTLHIALQFQVRRHHQTSSRQ